MLFSDYDYLIVRDLQAAGLLKQVHSQTQGCNGYVQIDLPPDALLLPETAIARRALCPNQAPLGCLESEIRGEGFF
jgi:hypothetical protein